MFVASCNSLVPTLPSQSELAGGKSCEPFLERYGRDKSLPRFATTLVQGSRPLLETEKGGATGDEQFSFDAIANDFNSFLDCYYVDISTYLEDAKDDRETMEELQALRGHAIVAVLTRYAAYNMTGKIAGGLHTTDFKPYDELAGDAAALLTRIEYAERLIRKESKTAIQFDDKNIPQVDLTAASLHGFTRVKRSNRVFSVIQVAFEAERPTARRAVDFFTRLAGLFTGPSFSDLNSVVNTALVGLEKAAFVNIYGRAYRADVEEVFAGIKGKPTDVHWKIIDDALRDACDRLAVLAGGVVAHCVPDQDEPSA